jgi:hypothetical protein
MDQQTQGPAATTQGRARNRPGRVLSPESSFRVERRYPSGREGAGMKAGREFLSALAEEALDMGTSISFTAKKARNDRPPVGCRPTK